jgi:hypothetical protein
VTSVGINDYVKYILSLTCGLFISLPLNYKIVMDIITIMQANFAEWDYNCVPAGVRINRSYAVKALANVTNVFMSTNAIMNHNIKKAKVLQIRT